jgi:hypothetical protein
MKRRNKYQVLVPSELMRNRRLELLWRRSDSTSVRSDLVVPISVGSRRRLRVTVEVRQ